MFWTESDKAWIMSWDILDTLQSSVVCFLKDKSRMLVLGKVNTFLHKYRKKTYITYTLNFNFGLWLVFPHQFTFKTVLGPKFSKVIFPIRTLSSSNFTEFLDLRIGVTPREKNWSDEWLFSLQNVPRCCLWNHIWKIA